MSYKEIISSDALNEYVLTHSLALPSVLSDIQALLVDEDLPEMQISKLQAKCLHFLVKLLKPKKILEIGTYVGYSSIAMASALPKEGKLLTVEFCQAHVDRAKRFWQIAELTDKIESIVGDGMTVINTAPNEAFDMIFVDAEKRRYISYLKSVIPKLSPSGLLIFDNTLWGGDVVDATAQNKAYHMREFNKYVSKIDELQAVLIPIGDGFTWITKK
jgi:predicted O-methyltransferase YrrM